MGSLVTKMIITSWWSSGMKNRIFFSYGQNIIRWTTFVLLNRYTLVMVVIVFTIGNAGGICHGINK